MAVYELVIEEKQPTCGGRTPTNVTVKTVTTDDPMAYVLEHEPFSAPEIIEQGDGVTVIRVERNKLWVKYEFTED